MMRVWIGTGMMIVAVGLLAGCGGVPTSSTENPASVTLTNYETVWETTAEVLDRYFDIAYENRYDGRMETKPVVGATIIEPWRLDSVGLRQRLESTLQTIRRRAFVMVYPSPAGGFQIVVEVYKEIEDLPRPIGSRMAGGAFFQSVQPIQQDVVTSAVTPGAGWISLGRDKLLEARIISDLHAALGRYDIESREVISTFKWPKLPWSNSAAPENETTIPAEK
ncbi:hypothetical protein K2X85_01990 [bacterium]|jgi:hypothetical protein|nr:hypothetical protein [bacterium]